MIRRLIADTLVDLSDWLERQAVQLDPPPTVRFRLGTFEETDLRPIIEQVDREVAALAKDYRAAHGDRLAERMANGDKP